ncbi:hypothetical protein NOF04DRAFT_1066720 [Fusarium oxysporum II5]|nr:hypothetical protein NOF04DRAFT_1066720 [Fusarium oxysporum II5]
MVLSLETSHRPTSSLSSPVFLLLLFLLPHFVILLGYPICVKCRSLFIRCILKAHGEKLHTTLLLSSFFAFFCLLRQTSHFFPFSLYGGLVICGYFFLLSYELTWCHLSKINILS